MLLPKDEQFIARKGLEVETASEDGMVCLVVKGFRLPAGYTPQTTDLLIRLPAGYPDNAPDMFWCDPPVHVTATGAPPVAADMMQPFLGRTWQRFSRHLQGGWRSGTDGLDAYLTLINKALANSLNGSP